MTRSVVAFLFAFAAVPALGQATASCRMGQVAEWVLAAGHPQNPVIEADVGGKRVTMLVNTSATRTAITRHAATRLGAKIAMAYGAEYAQLDGLRAGAGAPPISLQALIAEGTGAFRGGFDMIVGSDVLSRYDVEFDAANDRVRLYRAEGCGNASLAYWAKSGAVVVPMETVESRFPVVAIAVKVNGREMRAVIASGMATSILDARQAREVGVTPESPDVEPAGCIDGGTRNRADTWRGTFDTVAIGAQAVRNARLRFGSFLGLDRTNAPDMLVGYDFFRSHRVLIANSQKRVYFTHVDGPAFPVPGPQRACADWDKIRTRAEVDAHLAKYPTDAGALGERAYFKAEAGDFDGARADVEAARRSDSGDPVSWFVAARFHREQGNAAQALVEIDEALRLRPDLGAAWVEKGQVLEALGRIDDAVAAYTAGIEAAPRNLDLLIERGQLLGGVGELDRAWADFEAEQKRSPKDVAALMRRGSAMLVQGRYDRALQVAEEGNRAYPESAGPYFLRAQVFNRQGDTEGALAEIARSKGATARDTDEALGWIHFLAGDYAKAATHMTQEYAARRFDRYLALWLHLARWRSGGDARREMEASLARIGDAWPAPLYRLMLGATDPAGAEPRDLADKPLSRRGHRCEHLYFAAQWHLQQGRMREGREGLEAAGTACPREYREFTAATRELKRMGP